MSRPDATVIPDEATLLITELPPNLSDEFMMSYRHVRPMAEIGGCDCVADAAGQSVSTWTVVAAGRYPRSYGAQSNALSSHCSVVNCNGKPRPKSPQPHRTSTNLTYPRATRPILHHHK